jgi:hypothetical protein
MYWLSSAPGAWKRGSSWNTEPVENKAIDASRRAAAITVTDTRRLEDLRAGTASWRIAASNMAGLSRVADLGLR